MQSQSHKKLKSGQLTLFGEQAFDPTKNCAKCKGGPSSHKGHDPRCWNNKRKSKSLAAIEEQRLKLHFSTALKDSEKCGGKHLTKEAAVAFFALTEGGLKATAAVAATTTTTITTTTTTAAMATTVMSGEVNNLSGDYFQNEVIKLLHDPKFIESTKSSRAPLPMLAFAKVVVDDVLRPKNQKVNEYFDGLTMTVPVPPCQQSIKPEYHSIVGQKLLHVDWYKMYGLQNVQCPHCRVGVLNNDRTNFSKNKLLFPIFVIDGPPMWAMVMSMTCSRCRQ